MEFKRLDDDWIEILVTEIESKGGETLRGQAVGHGRQEGIVHVVPGAVAGITAVCSRLWESPAA